MILDDSILKILYIEEPSIQELRNISKKLNIKLRRSMKKRDIIKEIKKEILRLESEGMITIERGTEIENSNVSIKLSNSYNKDLLKVRCVGPKLIYFYWDFSKETRKKLKTFIDINFFVRIEEVKDERISRILEIPVNLLERNSKYINVEPDSTYTVKLGYKNKLNEFIIILSSKTISTPNNIPKYTLKENWLNKLNGEVIEIDSIKNIIVEKKYIPLNKLQSGSGSFVWMNQKRTVKVK